MGKRAIAAADGSSRRARGGQTAAEFRAGVLAFLDSLSVLASGDLEILGVFPPYRSCTSRWVTRNSLVASILVHFVDERLPAVRILFAPRSLYAAGARALTFAVPASYALADTSARSLEVRWNDELLFFLPAGRLPPGAAELGEYGLVSAIYEGCSLWPDRRDDPPDRPFPSFSLDEILETGPRYAVRVRALSGRLLCQLAFQSCAKVGYLLREVEEAALDRLLPQGWSSAASSFEIVFPEFSRRDAASLQEIFPERRASLRGTCDLGLNLELFHLGVADYVDSHWIFEVTVVRSFVP